MKKLSCLAIPLLLLTGCTNNTKITNGIFGRIKTTYTNGTKKRINNVRNKKPLRINGR